MARRGETYVRTYERTKNLPILQDFVPYRGRCPKKKDRKRDRNKESKHQSKILEIEAERVRWELLWITGSKHKSMDCLGTRPSKQCIDELIKERHD